MVFRCGCGVAAGRSPPASLAHCRLSRPAITLFRGDRLRVTGEGQVGRPGCARLDGTLIEPATIPCTLGAILQRVVSGERVWFDDGKIGGLVTEVGQDGFTVEISHARPGGAKLRADKGINLPDTTFDLPALTEKDHRDLGVMAAICRYDWLVVRAQTGRCGTLGGPSWRTQASQSGIVLKIENRRAFDRLPHIPLTALRSPPIGIMVAMRRFAVEMGFETACRGTGGDSLDV